LADREAIPVATDAAGIPGIYFFFDAAVVFFVPAALLFEPALFAGAFVVVNQLCKMSHMLWEATLAAAISSGNAHRLAIRYLLGCGAP
jgi:hypothetical protein